MENTQCSLQASPIIKDIIVLHNENRYDKCLSYLEDALKQFSNAKEYENASICLSLIGLNTYYKNKEKYLKAFNSINDGKYLADSTNNITAQLINEFVTAKIELKEQHNKEALLYLRNAQKLADKEDIYNLKPEIESQISKINTPNNNTKKRDPLVALLKIGQAVAAETDINILLKVIAEETKAAIQADRCSVFLYDKKNEELWSKVALGIESQEIRFTVHKGLAGHVVQTGETINIKDAYSDGRFNPEIDRQTGYHTKTILCMPIKNLNQEIIGAFQVLNKFDGEFNEEDEELLIAIGSSAGIALENAQLFHKQEEMLKEQKQIFKSFIDTLATSIDARDKITAGHSSRVRLYSGLIARAMNLDEKMINIVETAATLHDIGKIGIRDSVLQKDGKLTDEEYKHIQEHAEITHNILEKIHISEDFKLVTEIASTHHEKYNGMGYYRHLAGEDIPLGGRILAVSDVFDAITSKRHYRDKMPINNVINILIKDSGSHFDKNIADCFLHITCDKIIEVFLTENHLNFKEEDRKLLSKYTILDLHGILSNKEPENYTSEEKALVDAFQFYYVSKSQQEEFIV